MAGKRVLLAAEFLRGSATLNRLLPLAAALAKRGHDVALAVPAELKAAVSAGDFTMFDAPRWAVSPPAGFVAVSYADVLMHGGYAAPDALRGLMTGFGDVLKRAVPDLLVADFAPTAMLAARVAGTAMAAVGDGFSLPPLVAPTPNMRPWANVAADAPASVEGRVLAVVNACLGALRIAELHDLRDLFSGVPRFLCTFQELDHYLTRPDSTWYGEVFPTPHGTPAVWPEGSGQRVYVDLDPRHPALNVTVQALDRLGLPALVQGVGLPSQQAAALERRVIQVAPGVDRSSVLSGCDVVVCQSLEVAAPALLAGKPLLMLPVFTEQMMTLHRVAQQGLGHGVAPDSDAAALDGALRRLVDDRACRQRAANFARAYDGYQPSAAIDAVADCLDELLTQQPGSRPTHV
jgi:UDP:flavonoid glycosyltransferase YjiC (YdhE family)